MGQAGSNDVDVDLGRLFASLKRDWRLILGVVLAVTLLAYLATMIITPRYMSETRILIETRESDFTRRDAAGGERNSAVLDQEGVTSQVEVIGSTDILLKVAGDLRLAEREEFNGGSPSLLARDRKSVV